MSDFKKLSFTSSEDIKNNPYDFLCVSPKEVKRIVTLNTSGTCGDEKRIFFTEEDLDYTIDFFHYGMSCLVDENDRVLVLLPGSAYGSIGYLLKKALEKNGIKCIVHGIMTDVELVKRDIEENNISCIVGIPMQVLYLSRQKVEVFEKYIKKILLSTDYVPDILVREISDNYDCKVFNHYGMTEMGYGGGVECEALNGYHLREGDLYFEIVDPETGKEVKDGEYGEVVFTTFYRKAMPLIRYRTGDIARFSNEKCKCGTFLRTMEKVIGRRINSVKLDSGCEVSLRDLDEIILKHKDVSDFKATILAHNTIKVELILTKINSYDEIKKEITNSINEKFGSLIYLDILILEADKITKITNSMIKRQIYDFREDKTR